MDPLLGGIPRFCREMVGMEMVWSSVCWSSLSPFRGWFARSHRQQANGPMCATRTRRKRFYAFRSDVMLTWIAGLPSSGGGSFVCLSVWIFGCLEVSSFCLLKREAHEAIPCRGSSQNVQAGNLTFFCMRGFLCFCHSFWLKGR